MISSGRALVGAAFAFVIGCGLVLVLASTDISTSTTGSKQEAKPPPDPLSQQALNGLRVTQKAQAALSESNYGQVKEHLRESEDLFTWILGKTHPGAEVPNE